MKNAITATRNDLNARFDRRYGRCGWFLVWDDVSREAWFLKNPGSGLGNEAGAAATEALRAQQVERVFTGDMGVEALKRLNECGIGSFIIRDQHRTLSEILDLKTNPITIKHAGI